MCEVDGTYAVLTRFLSGSGTCDLRGFTPSRGGLLSWEEADAGMTMEPGLELLR